MITKIGTGRIRNFLARPEIIASLIFLFFFITYTFYSLIRHFSFASNALDLGIYTQVTYLGFKTLSPFSSIMHLPILANNFSPILILISPIYRLFPTAATLLVIQSLFISLSSIPLFFIAFDKLKNKPLATLLTLCYLSSSGITHSIAFDFHLTSISVLPLSLLLFAWYFRRWKLYVFSIVFCLLIQEDMALFIAGVGVYSLLKKQNRVGIISLLIGLLSFYLIKFQVMPKIWAGAEKSFISFSQLPLTDPISLLGLLITNPLRYTSFIFDSPIKIQTVHTLLGEFGYLPLLSPLTWVVVMPYLYFRFSTNFTPFWQADIYLNASIAVFLTLSAILAIDRFRIPAKPVGLILTFVLLTNGLSPNSITWSLFTNQYNPNQYSYINKDLGDIPKDAAISAQSTIAPHLANRPKVYLYPEVLDAQYIILDSSLYTYPMLRSDYLSRLKKLNQSPKWEVKKKDNTLTIFKRRALSALN